MGGKNSIVNIKLAGVSSMFMFMFILIIFVVIVIYKYYKDKENKGIDCIGEFTECNSKCLKTYIQTSPSSGNGKDCPFSNNSTVVCFDNEGLCNTNKEEYISKSKNNKLNVEVSLDYNINEIPEGSLERDVFEDNFKDEISKTIGVDINKIEILEIIEGSVNVIFTINEEDTLDSDNIIQSINTISELSDIPIIDSRIQLQPLDVIYCSNNNDILEDYQCQGDTILRSRSHEIIKYIDENVDDNIINERCCIDKKKCNTDPDIVEECINIDKIINNINYCDKNECIISRDIEQCCQDMTCEEAIENELVDCYAIDGKENISDLNIIGNTNDICCVDEPDIDCIGEWSTCTQDCSDKIYNISVFQSGKGRDCDYEDGDIDECNPGDDDCPRDCDGEWSPCDENCESIWTEYASKSGNGAACPDTPLCNPGDGDCPRNCDGLSPPTNGQMNTCTETILHGSSCIKECDTGYTLSGIQPSCDDGTLTDTVECIKDIDCTGYWSPCNDECISTYSVILDQSGSGVSCLIDDGQTQECNPGEGSCPRDCAGSWSDCNEFCSRTWIQTVAPSSNGEECPSLTDTTQSGGPHVCRPGDGACPDRCLELEELGLAWFGRKEPDEDTREPIWKKGHGCRNAPNRNSADQGTMSWWNYYTHGTDPVCNEDNSTWMEWHVVDTGTRAEEDGHDYGRRCEGTIGEGNRPCTVDDCLDPKSGGGSPGTYNCRWNDENLPWEPNQESIINNSLLCIDPTLSIRGHDGDSRCHNPDVCSDDSIGPPACLYSYCKAPDTNYFNANRTLADMKWTRANYRIYEGNVARPGKCKEVARVLGGNTGEQDCVPRTCGTPDNFDCSSHAYDLHASPSTVPCATDSCTDTECCTVIPESPATVSQVPATGTEELGRVGDRAAGSSLPVSLEEVQVGPTAPPAAAVLSSQALLGHRPSSLSHLAQPASSSSSSSSSSSRSFWDDLDEFLPFR